ncbi:MAG: N-acetylmuramoyl-L-alanine amidase [Elusimicrobia bacterium]|nr:N-acetylmuramoyl-L-alanine amidase [Elusimicrobiota bacterium]
MGLWTLCLLLQAAPVSAGDLGATATAWGEPLSGSPKISLQGALELEESDWIGEPFDAVLVQGVGGTAASSVQVARSDALGSWGPWIDASARRHPGRRFWAKAGFPDARPGRLRVRVTGAVDVEFYAVETFKSRTREERPFAAPRAISQPPPDPAAVEPEVIERANWGAKPPHEAYSPLAPERFTQHHTAGKHTTTLPESLAEMRFLQDFHQRGRGWNDIGYHFLIDGAGRVFRGRPIDAQGAHVLGQNEGNVGISLLGNYHPPYNDAVSPAQREAIRRLGAWLRDRYGVAPSTYRGHRDYNPKTDCPGDLTYSLLPEIQRAIEATPAPLLAFINRLRLERLPALLNATAR